MVNTTLPAALFWGKRPGTPYKGRRVGSRAGQNCFGKIRPKRHSISGPSSRNESLNQVRYPYSHIFYMLITYRFNVKAVFNFSRVWKHIILNFIALMEEYKFLISHIYGRRAVKTQLSYLLANNHMFRPLFIYIYI